MPGTVPVKMVWHRSDSTGVELGQFEGFVTAFSHPQVNKEAGSMTGSGSHPVTERRQCGDEAEGRAEGVPQISGVGARWPLLCRF